MQDSGYDNEDSDISESEQESQGEEELSGDEELENFDENSGSELSDNELLEQIKNKLSPAHNSFEEVERKLDILLDQAMGEEYDEDDNEDDSEDEEDKLMDELSSSDDENTNGW